MWSNISKRDAIPKEKKPNGIKDELFICVNLFREIQPINIGKITACKWAINIKEYKNNAGVYIY